MAVIYVGSARHDENNKYSNGSVGDSLQKSSSFDTIGEVSMQKMYTHSKGWYVLRAKSVEVANLLAEAMTLACNNACLGYDQSNRGGVLKYGIKTKTKTECDCSSLVRECIKYATAIDVGNFTTANEVSVLEKSGLFENKIAYSSQSKTPVYNGDILCTKTKGHTVIVVKGNPRQDNCYYPKYTGTSNSFIDALKSVGEKDTSLSHRKQIALANNIGGYTGTSAQNTLLLTYLKQGTLAKA